LLVAVVEVSSTQEELNCLFGNFAHNRSNVSWIHGVDQPPTEDLPTAAAAEQHACMSELIGLGLTISISTLASQSSDS
jgi:hypothetical protein